MSEYVREIKGEEYEELVAQHKGLTVLDFYSTECPPCEALAPKLDAVASLFNGQVSFLKIFRQENRELAQKLQVTGSPTLLFFRDGELLPQRLHGGIKKAEIKAVLQQHVPAEVYEQAVAQQMKRQTDVDLIIMGAGPAGLTAALYAAAAKISTIVIDPQLAGGKAGITHQVCNYPGFIKPVSGMELMYYFEEQAKVYGTQMRLAVDIDAVDLDKKTVLLDGEETIQAKAIIIATGSHPREIGVKGEKEYKGKGVSYCATCDGKHCEGKDVVVIGGGNSAIEESLFLTKFARKLTIVHQFDTLQANKEAQEKIFADPKVEFLWNHEPREFVMGNAGSVDRVIVEDLKTGGKTALGCGMVFVFAGFDPNLDFAPTLKLDKWGYALVDDQMQTNIPGVYACGDVNSKKIRQITTAVSDGTIAAIAAGKYIDELSG